MTTHEQPKTQKLKGADILVNCLIEQGVDTVFGYPGGQIIDVFDSLYTHGDRIRQILTSHEQGASHAADGYARVSGKVGVVIATSGPGATNLVTGIANAYMDSVPMVAITGNVPVASLGRDSFQEVDIAGITMPVTKHNYIVKDVAELADTIREAFAIAAGGRPGPVLVDVPKNVQQQVWDYTPAVPKKAARKPVVPNAETEKALKLVNEAERPLIYTGGGCILSGASRELIRFAEALGAPVASSMMGLGAFPASHPLYLGMMGMHGAAGVAYTMRECDTVIAVGARFTDRVAADRENFCKHARIVHIDIDNAEIDKNVTSSAHITGDVRSALDYLLANLSPSAQKGWAARAQKLRDDNPPLPSNKPLCPHKIIRAISDLTPDDQILATDVGQHQMWAAQSYRFMLPRTFVTSGGLGTMGYGMGAAMGACFATGRRVVLVTGDGSFHMNLNELATAVKYRLPLAVFLFNNNTLGMVRQWQTLFYDRRYSSTTLDSPTDYKKLADAFGADYLRLERDEEIESVVKKAVACTGPVLVECLISPDEFVLPMLPPGKGYDDIITVLEEN